MSTSTKPTNTNDNNDYINSNFLAYRTNMESLDGIWHQRGKNDKRNDKAIIHDKS